MLLIALSLSASDVHAYDVKDYLPRLPGSRDAHEDHSGAASLEGVVEVPLYRSPFSDQNLIELTALDGSKHLFEITLGNAHMVVSDGFLGASGAEASERNLGKGDVRKVATVDFDIGEATFDGVQVESGYGGPYSGQIGLAAFRDVAVAVLPSQGVVRLGSADASAEVLGSVDGAALSFTTQESLDFKDGERKGTVPAIPMVVDGTVLGQPVRISLHTGSSDSTVSRSVLTDAEPLRKIGSTGRYALDIDIPGLSPIHVVAAETVSTDYSFAGYQVRLGTEVTSGWDMAWDGSGALKVAEADQVKAASWFETELAEAMKPLTPEADEDDETPPAPEGEDAAPLYTAVAKTYGLYGKDAEALEWAKKALEADASSCSAYHLVGSLQLGTGDFAGAIPNLQKAGEMYAAWGDQDYEVRAEILEEKARVEDGFKLFGLIPIIAPGEWDGELPQPNSCHTAWGDLASAHLALGHYEQVEQLWDARRDLDPNLGLVAGNAFLAQGKLNQATGAYSWNLQQTGVASRDGSLGLAMVQAATQREAQSLANLELAYWHGDDDLQIVRAYGQGLAGSVGAEAAATKLGELAGARPDNAHHYLVQAELLAAAGQDAKPSLKKAVASYERLLQGAPGLTGYRGGLSRALAHQGQADTAKAQATRTLEVDPRNVEAQLVLAELGSGASLPILQAGAATSPALAAQLMAASSCAEDERWSAGAAACRWIGPAADREAIAATVQAGLAPIQACYTDRLKRNRRLAGKLEVGFTIEADGSVSQAAVTRSELNDEIVESCVVEAMQALSFPVGSGSVQVSYPFTFEP
jgi:tetratricopeptide (TPR) repeat protein